MGFASAALISIMSTKKTEDSIEAQRAQLVSSLWSWQQRWSEFDLWSAVEGVTADLVAVLFPRSRLM
jgi:hypothetical protein